MVRGHEQLLREAARRLLREKGLSRTTARDLVAASGTNLNSIRYHFGSKDELMAGALGAVFEEWTSLPVAAAAAAAGGDSSTQLLAAVRTMLGDLPGKRQDFLGLLDAVGEIDHLEPLAEEVRRLDREALAAVARSIREASGLPVEVAAAAARVVVALHDGLALQSTIAADPAELGDLDALIAAVAGVGVTLAASLGVPGAAEVAEEMSRLAEVAPTPA